MSSIAITDLFMNFRFRKKETPSSGIRRIIRELTAALVGLLADQGNHVVTRVHEARRNIKRLRAILHLILPSTDEKAACELERHLRSAAKRLSRSRDAEVCVATFELITKARATPTIGGIRVLLRKQADRAHRASSTPAQLATIATTIRENGHRLAELPLSAHDWDLLQPGLDSAYREARKMRKIAGAKADHAEIHQWRKRIKRLHFQLELLWPWLDKSQRMIVKKLDQLGQSLGDFHDLDVLEVCFRDLAAHGIAKHDSLATLKLSEKRRKGLMKKICKLSKASFCQRTKKFMAGLHSSWKRSRKKLAD